MMDYSNIISRYAWLASQYVLFALSCHYLAAFLSRGSRVFASHQMLSEGFAKIQGKLLKQIKSKKRQYHNIW